MPFGNNKVAIRYDKGVEQTQLLIAVVKEKRWVYEPIKKTCKMEWAAGPYEKCIQIFAKCIFGHFPTEILNHFLFIGEFTTITLDINLTTLIRQSSFICLNYQSLSTSSAKGNIS